MPVYQKHKEYAANESKWKQVRDCVAGDAAVKAAGEQYLPKPNPSDTSTQNDERYKQYLKRAMFLAVTGRTERGLIGAVYRTPPSHEVPTALDYLIGDADGGNQSLEQLGKWATSELMEAGRVGLITEYSAGEKPRTKSESEAQGRRAFILGYSSESIINWRYDKYDGIRQLVMVVLHELVNISTDPYTEMMDNQYRVLGLDESGYFQEVYDKAGVLVEGKVYPAQGDGSYWRSIPFIIIGAEDNQDGMDEPALYDLSVVNLAHYRNSADYEEGIFMHGQGTLFISLGDMNASTFQQMNPNGVLIGARAGVVLGKDSNAQLLQMSANSTAREAMQDKEAQMISIGARLITDKAINQSATEARINASSEVSVLNTLSDNLSEGIEMMLECAAIFSNVDAEEISYQINKQFFDEPYDPQATMASIAELDRGLIARSDYRTLLRKSGRIAADRTDEMIDEEVGASGNGPDLEDDV